MSLNYEMKRILVIRTQFAIYDKPQSNKKKCQLKTKILLIANVHSIQLSSVMIVFFKCSSAPDHEHKFLRFIIRIKPSRQNGRHLSAAEIKLMFINHHK